MLNSFCGYSILMLVNLDDLQFGFNMFTKMIKNLIFYDMLAMWWSCLPTQWLCFGDKDVLPNCVKRIKIITKYLHYIVLDFYVLMASLRVWDFVGSMANGSRCAIQNGWSKILIINQNHTIHCGGLSTFRNIYIVLLYIGFIKSLNLILNSTG